MWSVRGCFGRLMVGLVCVGFVALLPVAVSPNVVCAAGTSMSALASCVVVGPRAAQCGWSTLVGCVRNGRVAVFYCVRGHGRQLAWRMTVPPSRWTPFPFRPVHACLVWCLPALVLVYLRSCGGCSRGVVGARLLLPPHGRLGSCGFCRAAASCLIVKSCLCGRHIRVGAG